MFTLRQMRFLVALADHLSFSQAAEACFVTQPTLSSGIKELEATWRIASMGRPSTPHPRAFQARQPIT